MKVNIPALEIPTPQVVIQFPKEWPLFEEQSIAAARFGITPRQMARMRGLPGFPATKIGKQVMIDIPRLYDWLSDYLGRAVPLE